MSENKEILNRIRNKIHSSEANSGVAGLADKTKVADKVKSFGGKLLSQAGCEVTQSPNKMAIVGEEYTMALAEGQNENVAVDKNMLNKLTASRPNNLGAMSKFANKQYS